MHISPDFDLPIEASTDSSAILAKKGAGKSNAAVVMAEEMYDAGVPFVAVDPKGDWWGVRSSADGDAPGLAIPVFGGRHGDVPLEATAGALLADIILGDDGRGYLSCVLDVSQFTISDQRRFLLDFGRRLFQRKDEDGVLHLFLEEAHEYLPQSVSKDQTVLVSTWQRIVKQGRFKGLGVTVISQRSAALNKDVLTQVDSLYVLRTLSPQDRAAVKAWLDVHVGASEIIGTLHELKAGEAWLWSPDRYPDPQRFRFRQRRTFDSGATPTFGEKARPPATIADVDLGAIKDQMADTIERAKADDPKELRKRIKALEQQVAQQQPESVTVEVPVEVPVPYIPEGLVASISEARVAVEAAAAYLTLPHPPAKVPPRRLAAPTPASRPARAAAVPTPVQRDGEPDGLGKGEWKVLSVLAEYPEGRSVSQTAFLAGYSAKASTIGNIISRLRKAGLVHRDAPVRLTPAGIDEVGGHVAQPSGEELLAKWRSHPRMGEGERKVLDALIEAWPVPLDLVTLCDRTGYSPDASTIGNIVSRLRKLGLVQKGQRALDPEFAEAIEA